MVQSKGFAQIALVVIVFVLLAMGGYLFFSKKNAEVVKENIEYSDWKSYDKEQYGISFSYPTEYALSEGDPVGSEAAWSVGLSAPDGASVFNLDLFNLDSETNTDFLFRLNAPLIKTYTSDSGTGFLTTHSEKYLEIGGYRTRITTNAFSDGHAFSQILGKGQKIAFSGGISTYAGKEDVASKILSSIRFNESKLQFPAERTLAVHRSVNVTIPRPECTSLVTQGPIVINCKEAGLVMDFNEYSTTEAEFVRAGAVQKSIGKLGQRLVVAKGNQIEVSTKEPKQEGYVDILTIKIDASTEKSKELSETILGSLTPRKSQE